MGYDLSLNEEEREILITTSKEDKELTNALKELNYLMRAWDLDFLTMKVEQLIGKKLTDYQRKSLIYRYENRRY